MAGTVHDGYLYLGSTGHDDGRDRAGVSVFPGIDDWSAAHRACWQLAGQPDSWQPLADVPPTGLEAYQDQLFDFQALIDDGHGWMLADPDGDTHDGRRSRQRILDLLRPGPAR